MTKRTMLLTLLAIFVLPASLVFADVRVVTTTPTLADIVRQVGGEHVKVESIMRGPENIHNVSPTPSQMMKLRKAVLFIHGGLDAEPWVPQLIKGARRKNLQPGARGNVDVSQGISLKEVPQRGELTRAMGDIHVYGNTHYVLDPLNGIVIARTIANALKRTDTAHAEMFEANYEAFTQRIREMTDQLVTQMEPYRGTPVVTYHRTWPYLRDRFGLVKIAEVEPKPGISPGPQHLSQCVETMQVRGAKIVIVETYNSKKNAEFVARLVGGRAVVLAQGVGAVAEADTYERLFEYNIQALLAAFEELGIEPQNPSVEDVKNNPEQP